MRVSSVDLRTHRVGYSAGKSPAERPNKEQNNIWCPRNLIISNGIRQREGSLRDVDSILKYAIVMVEIRSHKPSIEVFLGVQSTGFKRY